MAIWEFPKIRGTLFGGPCNDKDPTIQGARLGSPKFGNRVFQTFRGACCRLLALKVLLFAVYVVFNCFQI